VEREVVVNTRYQPLPPNSLLQLSAWVHYTPHILQQQARTVWWNPQPPGDQVCTKFLSYINCDHTAVLEIKYYFFHAFTHV
jgi:hypothetical protein